MIPEGVTASAVAANFENGVLEIRVPLPAAKVIAEPQKVVVGGAETKEVKVADGLTRRRAWGRP